MVCTNICAVHDFDWEQSDLLLPWQTLLSQFASVLLHMGAHQQSWAPSSPGSPNNTHSCARRAQPAGTQNRSSWAEPSAEASFALAFRGLCANPALSFSPLAARPCGRIHESAQANSSSLMCSPPLGFSGIETSKCRTSAKPGTRKWMMLCVNYCGHKLMRVCLVCQGWWHRIMKTKTYFLRIEIKWKRLFLSLFHSVFWLRPGYHLFVSELCWGFMVTGISHEGCLTQCDFSVSDSHRWWPDSERPRRGLIQIYRSEGP